MYYYSTSNLAICPDAGILVNDYVMPQLRASADCCRWVDEVLIGCG